MASHENMSQSMHLGLLQFLPQAIVVIGYDSSILGFSPAAQELFPLLRKDQPFSFVLRDPELLDCVEKTRKDTETRALDILIRLPVQRFLSVKIADVPGTGTLIALTDQSTSRRVEQMRVDFVANASHELRTPLASLLGFIETLKGPARKDVNAQEQFLGIMESQAKRMARLIDDLLSLSRIEMNAHLRPRERVNLPGVIEQIRDALTPLSKERGVTISITHDDTATEVSGDRDELLRLFENLIENAIKYGDAGQPVEITIKAVMSGRVSVEIRDHGPGIPAEHLPRLTERFYRVSAAASRETGGTGLGLAIVKHIIARHRGQLDISSEIGKGSCFRVTLDMAREISE